MTARSPWCPLLLSAGLFAAISCGDVEEPTGPPFSAYVIDQVSLDPETGRGEFSVAARTFTRLTNVGELRGPGFRVLREGVLEARQVSGSIVSDGLFKDGSAPDLRFRVEGGQILARDYNSLAMLSLAWQFERMFDALENQGPYTPDQVFAGLGPPDIYFEPAIELSGDQSTTAILKFNAFFQPETGSFGFARRSSAEDIPLAADIKVVSHEVGHAVFFKAFDANNATECKGSDNQIGARWFPGRLEEEYVMRGLNEGFADWHSFSVTGGVDALANQSSFTGTSRNFRAASFGWSDLELFGIPNNADAAEEDKGRHARCTNGPYCIGTLFAHALYNAFSGLDNDLTDVSARAEFTRGLVTGLEQAKQLLMTNDWLPPAPSWVADCSGRNEFNAEYDGKVLSAVLGAWLTHLEEPLRTRLCASVRDTFGTTGVRAAQFAECAP
ncbi:MAG: hypothetical protein RL701_462 [Pseudomonadota bacterium]